MSSFIGIEPVNDVKRYDAKQHKYIDVPRLYIVKQYNSYMDGIDKLDMMSALYKARKSPGDGIFTYGCTL